MSLVTSTIAAEAYALPGVTLVIILSAASSCLISTPRNEGIYSKLVLSLVEYFLGKSDFSIGIALIAKTAHKVASEAVAEAINSTAVGQVVLNTCAEIAVEINC